VPKVTLTVFARHGTTVIRLIVPGDLTASKTIRGLAERRCDANQIDEGQTISEPDVPFTLEKLFY